MKFVWKDRVARLDDDDYDDYDHDDNYDDYVYDNE